MKTLFISLLFIPQLVWSANFDVKCKSTVLNDTQVKSLPTGAVQILPSAPSGSFYLLQRIIVAPRQGNLDYGNFDPTPVILFSYGARNLYRCVLTHLVGSAYDPDDILDFSGDRIWSFPVG
jgi:hypothetical protein